MIRIDIFKGYTKINMCQSIADTFIITGCRNFKQSTWNKDLYSATIRIGFMMFGFFFSPNCKLSL